MRQYIDIITEAMSRAEALSVFHDAGADVVGASPANLKAIHRQLAMKHHPDRGGSSDTMKMINAAYDILNKTGTGTGQDSWPHGSAQDPEERARRRQARQDAEDREWRRDGGRRKGAERAYNPEHNIYFVKEYLNSLAMKYKGKEPVVEYTVWNYDGAFFRGCFTVYGCPSTFTRMGRAMISWDSHYESKAVFVGRGHDLWLVILDGREIVPAIKLEHNSLNSNPSNDSTFMHRLPETLDNISKGETP